jgi:hypothetical protein
MTLSCANDWLQILLELEMEASHRDPYGHCASSRHITTVYNQTTEKSRFHTHLCRTYELEGRPLMASVAVCGAPRNSRASVFVPFSSLHC